MSLLKSVFFGVLASVGYYYPYFVIHLQNMGVWLALCGHKSDHTVVPRKHNQPTKETNHE
jgi:hypothetical protein